MPDYAFRLLADIFVVTPEPEFDEVHGNESVQPALIPPPSGDAIMRAKKATPSWHVYYLENEWRAWMKAPPRNPEAASVQR